VTCEDDRHIQKGARQDSCEAKEDTNHIAEAIPRIYEHTTTRGKVIDLASGKETTIKKLIDMIAHELLRQGDTREAQTWRCQTASRRHISSEEAHPLLAKNRLRSWLAEDHQMVPQLITQPT
jgi:hypothetical protein